MVAINSWGRLGKWPHEVRPLVHSDDAGMAAQLQLESGVQGISYGMGKSYGDVCLNAGGVLWQTRGLDRCLAFDPVSGLLRCEAGILLRDIQRIMMPQGWMLPVTPGTQLITVGGAIANDVHGKNHHGFASFGNHVQRLRLMRTDGTVMTCGPEVASDWFSATVGGLGLTGLILEATLQLCRTQGPWLETETQAYNTLQEFFEISSAAEAEWTHTVSWVDCMSAPAGRGIFMRGNFVATDAPEPAEHHPLTVPFVPPFSLFNRFSLRPMNQAYFWLQRMKAGRGRAHYEQYFYPLDNLLEWNRIYGPSGFYQYQSVVPTAVAPDALQAMLDAIALNGEGSFLAVLKTFGSLPSLGMLSFPREGVTLALDFPNRGNRTLKLFERLDAIVREAGGRLYPAKDARMPADLFESGFPRLNEFMRYRDPGITSSFARRVMG